MANLRLLSSQRVSFYNNKYVYIMTDEFQIL